MNVKNEDLTLPCEYDEGLSRLTMDDREIIWAVINNTYYVVNNNDIQKIVYNESDGYVDVITSQYVRRYFTGINEIKWKVRLMDK